LALHRMPRMPGPDTDPTTTERAEPTVLREPGAPIQQNMASIRSERPPPSRELNDLPEHARARAKRGGAGGAIGWLLAVAFAGAAGAGWYLYYRPLEAKHAKLEAEAAAVIAEKAKLDDKLAELETQVTQLQASRTQLEQTVEEKEKALADLTKVQDELASKLEKEIARGDVLLKQVKGELVMDLADKIMFDSGEAQLNDSGKDVLKRVAETLVKLDKVVQIGGHTDDVPISDKLKAQYPSNWELSAARALNVVRFLQDDCKIPGKRLAAAGFAEYRPAASNRNAAGRRKNRRIEVILLERR
jgi:chemotaxis protein MotB